LGLRQEIPDLFIGESVQFRQGLRDLILTRHIDLAFVNDPRKVGDCGWLIEEHIERELDTKALTHS
jgi:hypothetical protein